VNEKHLFVLMRKEWSDQMKKRREMLAVIAAACMLLQMLPMTNAGTLQLVKGSWDVIGLDHNNVNDGPNEYVIQIHVTNSAGTTAHSVSGTLTWTSTNSYINLDPNESTTKSLGDIAAGATVDLFYLIEITRDSSAYNTTRDYSITVQGTDTGTADTITGTLSVARLRSQARNEVVSMVASTTSPAVGDTFTVTVHSQTGAKNYAVVNLPATSYDPIVIEPVSVSVTWQEPPNPVVTSDDVRLDLPNDDDFTSVWTFRALSPGTSDINSYITDQSGGSYHYNADYPDTVTITVRGIADLRLEKTVDNSTPNIGDTVTFTITVYNDGPNDASSVSVEDVLPAGLNYVSDTPSQGTYNNVTGIWTVGSLANGGSATLQITVQVTTSGSIKNVAQVYSSSESDPDSTPNNDDGDQSEDDEDSETITVPPSADLRMDKTVSDPNPNVGDTITFTITVYNDGPDTATNITVEDVIPSGFTYVASSIAGGDSRDDSGAPTLTWTINSLASSSNVNLTFQVVVQASGTYKNVAQVTASDQYDPDSTPNNDDGDQSEDDEDSETASPQEADLRLDKTVSDPTPDPGDTITFTITVYNDGPDAATNVTVEDVIPSGFTYVASSIAGGDSRDDSGDPVLTWTINSLAGSSNVSLTFQVVVQASGTYKNVAQVTASDQYDPDSTPNNDDGDQSEDDEDSETATPPTADLRMEKAVSDPNPNVGDTITFTITVYNDGPDTATNVTVEDVIPSGYIYSAGTIAGGDSRDDSGAPTLTWTINSLTNSSSVNLTFQVVVQASGTYKNVAQVTASDQYDPDSTPNNDDGDQSEDDEDSETTAPQQADLRIKKSVDDSIPDPGDTITFTITVYNDGPDTATNITVEDVIPSGYIYSAGTIAGGDSRNDSGAPTLTWTINSLANSSNVNLTFQAVVQASGIYKNVAQVTASDQYDPDSTPNNDDGDQSEDDEDSETASPPTADLTIQKAVSDPNPNVGDTITFTITVYNYGPDAATNVTVEDVIPSGFTYVASSIAGGDSRDDSGDPVLTWTINSLASGANVNLTFQVVVQASGIYKNVAQVTASDQYDPDSTPNNDDGDQSEDDEDSETASPQEADLHLEKTVSDPNPNVGDTITFTITVYNDGPDTATNITVEDVIPSGFTYVASSIAGGDSRDDSGAPTLTWTINSLANSSNVNLTFQAVVQASGTYKNVAQVTASDQYDPDSTPNNDDGDQSEDDEDSETAAAQEADLRLDKTVNNQTPNTGDTITFTITVYNDGPDTATNVAVEDILPSGLNYVSDTPSQGTYNNVTGIWTVGSLTSGTFATLQITAQVTGTGVITNTAQVHASDCYDPDSTPDNDNPEEDDQQSSTLTVSQTPLIPGIDVKKSVFPKVVEEGDVITFTITVTNTGQVQFTSVQVVDTLPLGLDYANAASIPPDSVTYNPDGTTTLTWNDIGSMNPGDVRIIAFAAVFNGLEPAARNTVTATGTPPGLPPVSDDGFVVVTVSSTNTPYQPKQFYQPLAYYLKNNCYQELKDLIEQLRSEDPTLEVKERSPCCESLEGVVQHLLDLVLERGLDTVYPEKWERVQELLPFVGQCCNNSEEYYIEQNYVASIYWSYQRNNAYRELIETLMEMLGF
jgi:uncharacterized repeat protein (TIGR01451 family)